MKKIYFLLFVLVLSANAYSQCTVSAFASKDTVICGHPVELSAFGQAAIPVMSEDFNTGSFGPGWTGTTQAMWNNPCSAGGVDGTTHLWMGSSSPVPRIVTTASFNLSGCASAGVNICFDLLFAAQGGSTPCEGPDEPQEGVYIQYSTNNGATWTNINYFDPNGGNDPDLTNWKNWCFQVPTAALTSNVRFRWFQDADSGAEYDHWGLDNVVIYCNDPSYNIVWQHDGYNAGPTGGVNPTKVAPHVSTTYNVTMSNGTNTCTGSVAVVVINPVLQVNAGNDTVVCVGTCAQLGATAKVIERPAAIRTYANNQPDTAQLASFGGLLTQGATVGINVTTLNMTTVLPGSILSVCIDQAKLQTIPLFGPTAATLTFLLQCPDGDTITLIPAGGLAGSGGVVNYNTILNQTCLVPVGPSTTTGAVPYTNSYGTSRPFDNLAGCTANGVWNLIVLPTGVSAGGSVVITGWSINFDDPELAYTGDYVWSPTTNMTAGSTTLTPTVCPTGPITYTLTLQDTAGCVTASDVVNVDTQTCCNFTLGVALTQPSCAQSNGSITITPSVAGTYTYTWAGSAATGATRTGLGAGSYAVTVTDVVNNCTQDTVIQLNNSTSMVANITINAQPTCAGNDGSVSLTLIGGTAPYNITIDTGGAPINITSPFPVPAPGQTLSNLAPMTVNVSVTDAQACVTTASAVLVPATNCCTFSAITATLTQPTCGQSNGGITVTGGNGTGTYTYAWSGGLGSGASISNVAAGSYTVTVTNGSPTCTVDSTFTLNSNSTLNLTLNPTNPTCAGNDGSIQVTLSGGTAPYTIVIDTGGTPFTVTSPIAGSQTLSNLNAMTVDVTITDAQSCTINRDTVLTAPTNCCTFTVSAAITQPACGATDGAITLTTANGSGNYTYSWANGSGSGNTATALDAGNYNVTITDVGFANCFIDTTFSLSNPNAPVINNVAIVDETCPASGDGTATVTASGGTGTLTYNWNTTPAQTTAGISNLTAGTYNFTVSDANGCQTPGSAVVGSGFCCTLATLATAVPPSCGQTTGSINVTIDTAGVTPYEYSLDGVTYVSSATFNNVTAGNYNVYTRDANGCGDTVAVVMPAGGANLQLTMGFVSTSCNGANDGEANTASLNGNGPFTYLWNNALVTDTIRNLAPGNYSVTVTDNAGCTGTGAVLVSDVAPLTTTLGDDILVCEGAAVTLNAEAGFATYAWSSGEATASISPVLSNTYTVTVTNANGCTASDAVQVTIIPTPALNLGDDKLVYEGDHVAIFSGVPGATQNSVYDWNPSEYLSCSSCANPVALAVDTITYTLTYNDENGCEVIDTITLNVIPVVELFWPNAFSPNGDGNNDFYLPFGSNVKLIDLKIFNRWGEKVFQSTNFFQGWDGTYKGEMQAPQLFVYEANVTMMNNSTKKFKGSFMLIR